VGAIREKREQRMSITITTTVWCDGRNPDGSRCGMGAAVEGDRKAVGPARRSAREKGWVHRRLPDGRSVDLCPRCARVTPGQERMEL
jgi:hypothetical protein